MTISDLRARYRAHLLEFAWSQWTQIGLSGDITRRDRWAIDPEALVLFSIEEARRDPRLFGEMLDWLALNGGAISLQRLRNLGRRDDVSDGLLGAVITWVSIANARLRWPHADSNHVGPPTPLFEDGIVGQTADPDATFAASGYLAPRLQRSGKSKDPDLKAPVAFAFRLRLMFGPGTRSEVVRTLLTTDHASLDASDIAADAAFAKRNVNDALSALTRSGVVDARWWKNGRIFHAHKERWARFLDVGPTAASLPESRRWTRLLPALTQIRRWLDGQTSESSYLTASEARDLIERLSPDLEAAGISVPDGRSYLGTSYLEAFLQVANAALAAIEPRAPVAR